MFARSKINFGFKSLLIFSRNLTSAPCGASVRFFYCFLGCSSEFSLWALSAKAEARFRIFRVALLFTCQGSVFLMQFGKLLPAYCGTEKEGFEPSRRY